MERRWKYSNHWRPYKSRHFYILSLVSCSPILCSTCRRILSYNFPWESGCLKRCAGVNNLMDICGDHHIKAVRPECQVNLFTFRRGPSRSKFLRTSTFSCLGQLNRAAPMSWLILRASDFCQQKKVLLLRGSISESWKRSIYGNGC